MLLCSSLGEGHSPEMAGKEKQTKLQEKTGCNFSDEFLTPSMESTRTFVDQEVVDISLLST